MGKRHHGKGEASGTSASRGRNGAVSADAADAAAAHGCGDAAACADAARSGTGAAEASGSVSTADVPAQPSSAPFFSVVLPTYSSKPYLAAALGDLQDQLFTDWEAIVVNDCRRCAHSRCIARGEPRAFGGAQYGPCCSPGALCVVPRPRRSLRFHLSTECV